jgi:uncharacterized membrane protein YhaH (DUF805 family)
MFNGRAPVREYFGFSLFSFFTTILSIGTIGPKGASLVLLGLLLPSLALVVRRLHDLGASGWLLLVALLPYVGAICLIVLMLIPSNLQPNKYGNSPLRSPF